MLRWLDNWLNQITMYRLLRWVLIGYLSLGFVLALFGKMTFTPVSLVLTTGWLIISVWSLNRIFAHFYQAPPHDESAYLTALILALVISPPARGAEFGILLVAPLAAIGSKYIFAIYRQHLFNPAALGVALSSLLISQSASWWIGNQAMIVFVALGGWLIVRKIRRWDVVGAFLLTSIGGSLLFSGGQQLGISELLRAVLLVSPMVFFASVMLTEPATMPPTRMARMWYGAAIGILFIPQVHIGKWYPTPETALLIGNLIFWIWSRRSRYRLRLVKKSELAPGVMEFAFAGSPIAFKPGQYFEWTSLHTKSDQRGQRRYFTIASSPTEPEVKLGVKFYPRPSTFKNHLRELQPGAEIIASQLDGDFTLPPANDQKLLWIAGGIGITPYRSMTKYLLDTRQSRDVVLLYAANTAADFVYNDIFQLAETAGWLRMIKIASSQSLPVNWEGERGQINAELLDRKVPDLLERYCFISGPQAMVTTLKHLLRSAGVEIRNIRTDYFPGLA